MKNVLLLLTLWLSISLQLYCVNHFDLITSMTGEHNQSRMGNSLSSLDFNGDGYDDLVVCSDCWGFNIPPGQHEYGKIYFYWGGPNFDNIPDFILTGTYMFQYSGMVFNIGDVNGDGIEDLGVTHYGAPIEGIYQGNKKFSIFFGRQTPVSQPDYSIEFNYAQYDNLLPSKLGDINGDGFDDVGLAMQHSGNLFSIIYGNSLEYLEFLQIGSVSYEESFVGLGDINNDGYGDFSIGYCDGNQKYVKVFYGGTQINVADGINLLTQSNYIYASSWATGDVNGDGIDDFIGYAYNDTMPFWFGNNDNVTTTFNLTLLPSLYGHQADLGLKYGDVNNDGYSDIIGTEPLYFGNTGRAGLWLGSSQFNGTLDYIFSAPENLTGKNFGEASCMGDFSGDGCCDYAISAPFSNTTTQYPGNVFVYAGNTQLADTTVGIDDETNHIPIPIIKVQVYPNPLYKNRQLLRLNIEGNEHIKDNKYKMELFDIKGKRVYQKTLNLHLVNTLDLSNMFRGKYLLSLVINNNKYTKKLTIK